VLHQDLHLHLVNQVVHHHFEHEDPLDDKKNLDLLEHLVYHVDGVYDEDYEDLLDLGLDHQLLYHDYEDDEDAGG